MTIFAVQDIFQHENYDLTVFPHFNITLDFMVDYCLTREVYPYEDGLSDATIIVYEAPFIETYTSFL